MSRKSVKCKFVVPFTFLHYDFFYFWCLHNSHATECILINKILASKTLHVSFCVVHGYKSFATQSKVILILPSISLLVFLEYEFPSTHCTMIHSFSSMTVHVTIYVAPRAQWYGFFQVWIFMWPFERDGQTKCHR